MSRSEKSKKLKERLKDIKKNKKDNSKDTFKIENKTKKKLISLKKLLTIIFILIILLAIKTAISVVRWQKFAVDLVKNTPSIVYDLEGNIIAQIGDGKIRNNISISNIPDNLKNAYISIEDQRFYSHNGVDLPRTAHAIFNYVRHFGSSSFGGSSITQQLVKNITGDNSSKVSRKVTEWYRAIALEQVLTKDEILESYMNIIYTGPNIYGVSNGAKYYFDKDVSELDLAECAFLAGINNSPNSYNPFTKKDVDEKIKVRSSAVLKKMLELEYITQEEYDEAKAKIDKGLKFKEGKLEIDKTSGNYTYHTDAMINELIEDFTKKYNVSESFALNYFEMSGISIYSTQDTTIQTAMQKEFNKSKYKIKSANDKNITSQAAMVIINNDNGQVVGCIGGIGEKTPRGFNRATQAYRQTGSSIKPIAVLVPGIDKKIITASTIINDAETTFDDGSEEGYSPTDYNDYRGEITVRQAVETSQNIPFVKMLEMITPKVSINYMEKMGITSLTKRDDNLNLALGGIDKGMSPLEMAAAYETIANDGIYIEPTFYTKIENSSGKIILQSKQKRKKVFSADVAYILKSLLTQPVNGVKGTATYCKINGIDVAAKTGTTNDDYDRWLCGFTPYYSGATWFGFDQSETINFNNKNPSGQIWSNVMKSIHSKLPNKQFELPENVESVEICSTTGKLASTGCKSTILEYYLEGTAPTEYCSEHGSVPKSYRDSYDTTPSPTLEPTPSHEAEQNPTPAEPEPVVETPTPTPEQPETSQPSSTEIIPEDNPDTNVIQDSTNNEQNNQSSDNSNNDGNVASYIDYDEEDDTFISSDDTFEQ